MNTAEMWIKAQSDGKIYETIDGDVAYSKSMGLVDKWDFEYTWLLEAWDGEEGGIDGLMTCQWKEMGDVMTVEEAEEQFGIRIIEG